MMVCMGLKSAVSSQPSASAGGMLMESVGEIQRELSWLTFASKDGRGLRDL